MSVDNGGLAFPSSNTPDHGFYAEGMTLRDYFAAKELSRMEHAQCMVNDVQGAYSRIAAHCYRMADAMLAERAK